MDAETFPLEAIISNEELSRRPARSADRDAERRGLELLAQELAGTPRRVLQKLSDAALELCRAHSAGISLLEQEGERRYFRWHAVSGQWAPLLWTTLPREFSPCGTVLDRQGPQLMMRPERYFTPMLQISPAVTEVLLIPFEVGGELVGTVWVVAHDESRRFDGEDRRLVGSLAKFAAMAYERLSSLSADDVLLLARLNKARALPDAPPARTVQKCVLVVDDNDDAAQALAALLKAMGHRVETACDGRTGIAAARRLRPDIVLLDLAMPDIGGHEAAQEMRGFLGERARIVALTGFGSQDDRQRALDAGFDQHVVKPIDPAFLKSLTG